MIGCPKCGGPTSVKDTRTLKAGTRRRRWCLNLACDGRVTTYEVIVGAGRRTEALGLIKLGDVARIKEVLASISPFSEEED